VPHPRPNAARRHLRLAGPSAERRPEENRAILLVRAVLSTVALFFLTVVALASAAVALLPVAWRRAPRGVRLRPLRPAEARIIPFQPRQRALPR
jgi:hypothetical protein